MAILTTFTGIDKHAHPDVRDLGGARRDATALWALLSDSIPGMKNTLLIDVDATVEQIRSAFDQTLSAAGPDDTVILSFSGHGTRDHRLVAHDTDPQALTDTTIPMAELASRFRESRAKVVLCILDCCFSGGAPARVLEQSPLPRDPTNPLLELAGEGRVLIAASNIDELAFEHPATRHGLLTKALIDVLRGAEASVNVLSAMAQVTEHVRAEASRMGIVQTPVIFGHVIGGIILPTLKPGERFFTAFPEGRGARIGRDIRDLTAFGLPETVLAEWIDQFSGGLNDLQLEAINEYRILDGESLLVVAPTSAGKTFIGEIAATRAIVEGRKAVFLLPYKALVNEKYDQFSALYGERLGMRVIRCTGDYSDSTGAFIRGKYDLAVLTYEMFLRLALSNVGILDQVGLVVLDEAQFITDATRGITVELLLTHLLAARQRDAMPQLIALSAVIGDTNNFDAWLGCRKLVVHQRPVPLIEGVLDRTGTFQYLDPAGEVRITQLLPPGAVLQRREEPGAQDMIVPLVKKLIQQGEKIIVFRNQRGPAQGCAKYLAGELGLAPATEDLAALPHHDLSSTSADLRECLQGGTAFHNSNLTREEKVVVERAFRQPDGRVRVLAATTTVAAGINTPASTVILAEQKFIGEDGRPFTVAEYKNMAGRAGRLGFNEEGKAIILASTAYQREELFQRYVLAKPEPINSSFDPDQLDTWLVRLLAQVHRVVRQDVVTLLANTYGGYLACQKHPEWQPQMTQHLETLLERMVALELLEQDGHFVQLTLVGRACGRSSLLLESAMQLVDLLRRVGADDLSAERLMALLQVLPDADGGYTPMMKRGRKEAARQQEAVQRYGMETVQVLQRYVRDEFDYYARCKRAALLWDWIQGTPLEVIEQRYSATPYQGRIGHGDVRKFADLTRFHLRSAHEIASIMFVGKGPSEESIETLLKQLQVGIPADGLELLSISIPLARGEYLALYRAGVKTGDDLWNLPSQTVREILGPARAAQLEMLRPARVDVDTPV